MVIKQLSNNKNGDKLRAEIATCHSVRRRLHSPKALNYLSWQVF